MVSFACSFRTFYSSETDGVNVFAGRLTAGLLSIGLRLLDLLPLNPAAHTDLPEQHHAALIIKIVHAFVKILRINARGPRNQLRRAVRVSDQYRHRVAFSFRGIIPPSKLSAAAKVSHKVVRGVNNWYRQAVSPGGPAGKSSPNKGLRRKGAQR